MSGRGRQEDTPKDSDRNDLAQRKIRVWGCPHWPFPFRGPTSRRQTAPSISVDSKQPSTTIENNANTKTTASGAIFSVMSYGSTRCARGEEPQNGSSSTPESSGRRAREWRANSRQHVARPVWPVATHRGVLTARRLVITFVPTTGGKLEE